MRCEEELRALEGGGDGVEGEEGQATDVGVHEDIDELLDDDDEEEEGAGDNKAGGTVGGQSAFAWFADGIVVINALGMAMQGFDDHLNYLTEALGYFATVFFIAEAIVKIWASGGIKHYLKDGNNQFDFTLVVFPTMGEVTCAITRLLGLGEDFIYQMLAFRAMRVFRIVKLTKHLTGLRKLTTRAFGSPAGVAYAMLVTIVFIFIYSLFGNELFKKSVEFAAMRSDFQHIMEAMKAMIQFLFGDQYFHNIEVRLQTDRQTDTQRERERVRERDTHTHTHIYIRTHTHMYIYAI